MPSALSVVIRTMLGPLVCTAGFRVCTQGPDINSNVYLQIIHSSSIAAAAGCMQDTAGSRTEL